LKRAGLEIGGVEAKGCKEDVVEEGWCFWRKRR